MPPGLSFDPHDGDIEGTPRKAGTWRVRILFEDVRCGDHAPGSVAVPVTFMIEPFEPRQVFERPGVRPSTGSVGDAYDNALVESFFATLECELIDRSTFRALR